MIPGSDTYSSHSEPPLPPPSSPPAPLAAEVSQAHPEAMVAGAAPEAVSDFKRRSWRTARAIQRALP
jgi:hypothetical protein